MYSKQELEKYITEERLKPYLAVTNNNVHRAIELYLLYTRINESLYFPLQNIELIVRNSFYNVIVDKYGRDWIFEKKYLLQGRDRNSDILIKQINSIIESKRGNINSNDLISNLNFGFWAMLLDSNFEVFFWRPCLRVLFYKYSEVVLRKEIQIKLKFIKSIRNRVFHHENLLKYNLMDSYREIILFISLIPDEFSKWTEKYSTFIDSYNNLKSFIDLNRLDLKIN